MPDYEYESKASAMGYGCICGVDEAGRGPLAGPVYAAAVILPQGIGRASCRERVFNTV